MRLAKKPRAAALRLCFLRPLAQWTKSGRRREDACPAAHNPAVRDAVAPRRTRAQSGTGRGAAARRATATMSHWHKLGFQAFLAKEIMRKDTLPFAIGMGFVALMGLGLNASITEEDRKSSAYHKQFVLNDRKGDH